MNRYAYYALKCESGGYAYTKAIDNLSFCGGNILTFSCDFYYEKGYTGFLFSQNGSVACEVKNGSVCWSIEGGIALKSNSANMPLWDKKWNHLDVVYDADKITMYLNRIPAVEKNLEKRQDTSVENLIFGKDFSGYIRNVRIVDSAFTQNDILKNCIQTQIEKEKLLLYIPFDESDVKDKGRNNLTVICKGFARVTTLAEALYFPNAGFAAMHGQQINPGTDILPEFTIAMRVFLYPETRENTILFENKSGHEDGFVLKLNQTPDNAFLAVETAGFCYHEKEIPLTYFEWQDLCVTVKGTQVKCYVNGELKKSIELPQAYIRDSAPQIYIGDYRKNGKTFYGAIDYLGIYDVSLSAERADEIAKVEPYIYDDNIRSLYLFHGEGLYNMVGEGMLSLSICEQKLLEGTVFENRIEPLTFRADDTFPGNELELWEANTLIDLCLPVIAEIHGITLPENIPGSIKWRFLQEAAPFEEVQNIFNNYDELQNDDIHNMLKVVGENSAISVNVFAMLGIGLAMAAFAGLAIQKFKAEAVIACFFFFLPLIAYLIDKLLDEKKLGGPDDPPPPPPPPIRVLDFSYYIELRAVQFCIEENGSLPLRENFAQIQTMPEWTNATEEAAKMAYLAKKQRPSIKIDFHYTPGRDRTSAEINLYGKSDVFGSFQSETVTCTTRGIYSVKADLSDFKITEETPAGCLENKIKWSYNSFLGTKTFLRVTNQNTHVIKAAPLQPWSLKDAAHYPTIELLELVHKIGKNAVGDMNDAPAFMEAMHNYLRTSVRIGYSPKEIYTKVVDSSVTDIAMDYKGLFYAINQPGARFGALDISAAAMYLAAMEGWKLQTLGFYGYEYLVEKNKKKTINSYGLWLKDVEAWGSAVTEETVRHYTAAIASKGKAEDIIVCDLVWNCKGSSEYLGNLKLGDYQKKVANSMDSFELGFIGYRIIESEKALRQGVGITYNNTTKNFVRSPRCDFKNYIKETYYFPHNLACCHRLSYAYMEEILITTFNDFKNKLSFTKEKKDEVLLRLYDAFYANGNLIENEQQNKEKLLLCIDRLCDVTKDNIADDRNYELIGSMLHNALYCLNNASFNLRAGYSNWNSSIGDAYDVEDYYIVFQILDQWARIDRYGNLTEINEESEAGIYIVSENDRQIWAQVAEIAKILQYNTPVIRVAYHISERNDGSILQLPYVYSSNNEFPFLRGQNRTAILEIYY